MIALLRTHRSFRLLWTGETISQVGNSLTIVVLPLIAAGLHASALSVSALRAAAWLPWLIIGLPAGAWIDRVRNLRALMIACDLAAAGTYLAIPVLTTLGPVAIWVLLVVALAGGTISVIFDTSYRVYLPRLLDSEAERSAGNSALQGSASAANIGGPGLAGLLVALINAPRTLIADSASFLVSAVCLLAIPHRGERRMRQPRVPLRGEIAEGLRYLRGEPLLRSLTSFGACSNLALTGYQSLLVLFLVRGTHLGPAGVGLVVALMGIGGVSGALLARPLARGIGSGRALLTTKTVGGAGALLIPLAGGPDLAPVAVAGGVLVGAGIVAGNIITTTFLQGYVPPRLYARTAATNGVINYGTIPIGAVLGGTLATTLGLHAAMWITTAMVPLASILLFAGPLRAMRELPSRDSRGALTLNPGAKHEPGRVSRRLRIEDDLSSGQENLQRCQEDGSTQRS